jgi:uncharacterized tellurite resistance protein B-like protein
MIDLVKGLFAKSQGAGPADQGKTASHDIRLAVCALFLEMANIDGEFSGSERDHVISLLKRQYNLPDEHIPELMEASKKELKGSIDLWQFTNLINQNYSRQEKIQIIEMVWEIVYADGRLDQHEDYLVHKLAKLLRLTQKDLIDAKLKVSRRTKR